MNIESLNIHECIDLPKKKVTELKTLCKLFQVKGYSKYTKEDLLDILTPLLYKRVVKCLEKTTKLCHILSKERKELSGQVTDLTCKLHDSDDNVRKLTEENDNFRNLLDQERYKTEQLQKVVVQKDQDMIDLQTNQIKMSDELHTLHNEVNNQKSTIFVLNTQLKEQFIIETANAYGEQYAELKSKYRDRFNNVKSDLQDKMLDFQRLHDNTRETLMNICSEMTDQTYLHDWLCKELEIFSTDFNDIKNRYHRMLIQ